MCDDAGKGSFKMKYGVLALLLSFVVAVAIAPLVIKWLRKLKFGQSILVYVEKHKSKSGTPTMGGVIFIFSSIVSYMVIVTRENKTLATISLLALIFFGVLGFLDDYIKIKFKQNEGLKPYQKIIGQFGLSLIISIYIYMSGILGGQIYIPIFDIVVDVGYWIIPLGIIFYIAVVNSVNLIDGLDGLCSSVTMVVLVVFAIILYLQGSMLDGVYLQELNNINILLLGVIGGLLGFMCFNVYPAKVFMGDTGSLALGGFVASVFALTKNYLLIILVGAMYVITSLSVIIQVVVFKLTGKRVFKMSPIHHHFESVVHEAKVTNIYVIVTILLGVLAVSMFL